MLIFSIMVNSDGRQKLFGNKVGKFEGRNKSFSDFNTSLSVQNTINGLRFQFHDHFSD